MIPGKSFCADTPNEPQHRQSPFDGLGTASTNILLPLKIGQTTAILRGTGITDPVSAGNHPVVPVLYSFDLQSYLIIYLFQDVYKRQG